MAAKASLVAAGAAGALALSLLARWLVATYRKYATQPEIDTDWLGEWEPVITGGNG